MILDDGLLSDTEIEEVISECLRESGIELPANDVQVRPGWPSPASTV